MSPEVLRAIVIHHGLRVEGIETPPPTGIINAIYYLGDDYVLRVPRNHPAHVEQARREARAIPAARAAGVQTPALISFDDSLDLLPVPYLITERIHGKALGHLKADPATAAYVWRDVGRNLARLHRGVPEGGPAGNQDSLSGLGGEDPRDLAAERARDGWFSSTEANWLITWLDRLAPLAAPPARRRFIHGDVQATNVIVDPTNRRFRALIDWGCSGWDDPAQDFKGMPFRAVPIILAGYREVGQMDDDDRVEARILWSTLWLILRFLPRGAAPGLAWGEQPTAMLMELFRFFLSRPGPPWDGLGPP